MQRTPLIIIVLTAVFALLTGIRAQNMNRSNEIQFSPADELSIQKGGRADLKVRVQTPEDLHIYVKHLQKNHYSILTSFSFAAEDGFQVNDIKEPKNLKSEDGVAIFSGTGTYTLELFDLAAHKENSTVTATLNIRTQACETESGICFAPVQKTEKVKIRIRDRAEARFSASERGGDINWLMSYDEAVKQARSEGRNVFVLITAPTWCGACKWYDRNTLKDARVIRKLNNDFVPLKVLDTSADKRKFSFRGYPTNVILENKKEKYKKAGALRTGGLLGVLNAHTRKDTDNDNDTPDYRATDCFEFLNEKDERAWRKGSDWGKLKRISVRKYNFIARYQKGRSNKSSFAFGRIKKDNFTLKVYSENTEWKGNCSTGEIKGKDKSGSSFRIY